MYNVLLQGWKQIIGSGDIKSTWKFHTDTHANSYANADTTMNTIWTKNNLYYCPSGGKTLFNMVALSEFS